MWFNVSLEAMVDFLINCWNYLDWIRFNVSGLVFSLADVFVTSFSVLGVCILLKQLLSAGLSDSGYDVYD